MANGTALLALPAGPSPLPPARWRCVEGRGADSGPTPSTPPPASRRRRGQGSPDAADTLRPASAVSRVAALPPRRGGPSRRRALRASPGSPLVLLERSRSSLRCLRPSRWCRFPLPATPSGPSRELCGGRVGKVEGRHPFSPRHAGGVGCLVVCPLLASGVRGSTRMGAAPRVISPAVGEVLARAVVAARAGEFPVAG